MDTILTVHELNFKLSQLLEARFPYVWIKGEVTNCTLASSGHIYFSLKDEQELLNCVWFKRYHQDLAFDPLTGECFENGKNRVLPKACVTDKKSSVPGNWLSTEQGDSISSSLNMPLKTVSGNCMKPLKNSNKNFLRKVYSIRNTKNRFPANYRISPLSRLPQAQLFMIFKNSPNSGHKKYNSYFSKPCARRRSPEQTYQRPAKS